MPPSLSSESNTKTLVSATSVDLGALDPASYYSVTLIGDSVSGTAHSKTLSDSLSGDTLLALGSAPTLIGGAGNDSLLAAGKNAVLISGSGKQTLSAFSPALFRTTALSLPRIQIKGSFGTDTMVVTDGGTFADSLFSGVNSVEILSIAGGSMVTLGATAEKTGVSTVQSGGAVQIYQAADGPKALTLAAGSGSDLFVVSTAEQFSGDSINGGGGADTLKVLEEIVAGDDDFSHLSGIQVLSLAGASSAVLGRGAATTGIKQVFQGSGGGAIVQLPEGPKQLSVFGSSGGDNVTVMDPAMLAGDYLDGGAGSDTLQLASGASLSDTVFAALRNTEVLALAESNTVSLGSLAAAAGLITVTGGAGADTIAQGTKMRSGMAIASGDGDDLISVDSGAMLVSDTISGGEGRDTLQIRTAATLNDASFAKVTGLEMLSVAGGSMVTLGGAAKVAGIASVQSSGVLRIYQAADGPQTVTLRAGSASDLFVISTAAQFKGDSISGGGGTDTLQLLGALNAGDSDFSRVTGISVLSLAGSSSAVLGKKARAAGIKRVIGGSLRGNYTQLADGPGLLTISGGSAGDSIKVMDPTMLSGDYLDGGAGTDTLQLGSGATLVDGDFSVLRNTEVLALTGSNAIELGSLAAAAGIAAVSGGTEADTMTQSEAMTRSLSLAAGGGDDLISVANSNLLLADRILGGDGSDTLWVVSDVSLSDKDFANIAGVEALSLESGGALTLGSAAVIAGIASIYAGSSTTLVQGQDVGALSVDLSAGSGNDFSVENADQLASDSYVGSGNDTLRVRSGGVLDSTALANVSGIESLVLGGGSSVDLDAANASGVSRVFGGNDDSTYTQSSAFAVSLYAGTGNDLVSIADAAYLADDLIAGGKGLDTLAIGADATLVNDDFASISGIEFLSLTGASAVTLDAAALAAGISSVVGGDGGSSLFQSAKMKRSLSLLGGAGSDLFTVADGTLLAGDWIDGGGEALDEATGNLGDTLQILSGAITGDRAFANVSGMEVLSLGVGNAATLGSLAGMSGITRVRIGSKSTLDASGDQNLATIDATEASAGKLLLRGSKSSATEFVFQTPSPLGSSKLTGGSGVDTLTIKGSDSYRYKDSVFMGLRSVEVLKIGGGGGTVQLGINAYLSGIQTIIGADAPMTLNQTKANSSALYVDGSANTGGGNFYALSSPTRGAKDTIIGSAPGNDTLALTTPGYVRDGFFANKTAIGVFQTFGRSAVTLDANAASAGITTVIGSRGSTTLSLGGGASLPLLIDLSATRSSNLLLVGDPALLSADTFSGSGKDTFYFPSGISEVGDAVFSNVTGTTVLSLSGSTSVTLDANAAKAGFDRVIGGAGAVSLYQTSGSSNSLWIDASSNKTGGNLFAFDSAALLAGNRSLTGSRTGKTPDTLFFTNGDTFDSLTFAKVSQIELLSLSGSNTVDLSLIPLGLKTVSGGGGDNAYTLSGLGTLTLDGTAGADTLFLSKGQKGLKDFKTLIGIEALSLSGSNTVDLSVVPDSLTSVFGGDGDNVYTLSSLGEVTLDGTSGADTVFLKKVGDIAADALGALIGIEALSLSGSNTVDLSVVPDNLTSVFGGGGDNVYTLSALGAVTLDGTSGADTVFLNTGGDINAEALGALIGIEALSLTGSNTVDLSVVPDSLTSVFGGDGDNVYTLSSLGAVTLDGTAGADTIFVNTGGDITSKDLRALIGIEAFSLSGSNTVDLSVVPDSLTSVFGGDGDNVYALSTLGSVTLDGTSGADTVFLKKGGDIAADALGALIGIEALSLTGSNTVDLSVVPDSLTSVFGGGGDNVYTLSALGSVTLDGTSGADTVFLNTGGDINAEALGALIGIEALSLSGSNTVDLTAAPNGLTSVFGGDGDNVYTLNGLGAVTLDGTSGADTIFVNTGGDITSKDLRALIGIEALSLSGSNTVDLSVVPDSLTSVFGGDGDNVYALSTLGSVTLDGTSGADTVFLKKGGDIAADALGALIGIEALSLTGSNTVDLSVVPDSLTSLFGGGGDNVYTLSALGSVTLDGTSGADTVFLNTGGDINAEALGALIGIEALSLSGSNTVDLSVVPDSLTSVFGGDGDNVYTLSALGSLTLNGTSGADTVVLSQGQEILKDFKTFIGIEALSLSGSNTVDLSVVPESLTSVFGGDGDNIYTLSALGAVTLDGTAGADTVVLSKGQKGLGDFSSIIGIEALLLTGSNTVDLSVVPDSLTSVFGGGGDNVYTLSALGSVTLDGTSGADTVFLNTGGDINAEALGALIGVEALSLTGSNTVDLSVVPDSLTSIFGGDGDNVYTLSALGAVTLDGTLGTDTVVLSQGQEILKDFKTFIGIEALSLSGSNTVDLSVVPDNLTSVFGGGGDNVYTLSALGAVTLDGTSGADTVFLNTGGDINAEALGAMIGIEALSLSGSNTVDLSVVPDSLTSVFGGGGDNVYTLSALGAVTLDGTAGADTVFLNTGGDINAEALGALIGIEALSLSGLNTVDLSVVPDSLTSVFGGDGDNVYTLSSLGSVTLDGTSGADTLVLNSGADITSKALGVLIGIEALSLTGSNTVDLSVVPDSLTSVFGGDGDNVYTLSALGAVTLDGTAGADTLVLSQGQKGLGDFSAIIGIEALSLTGSNTVDLTAVPDSLASVFGGDGKNVYTVSTLGSVTLNGTAGADTVFLNTGGEINAEALGALIGVEVLSLSGANSITLDAGASSTGILSLFGGTDATTLNRTADFSSPLYVNLTANVAGGNLFAYDYASLVSADTILSAGTSDTLALNVGDAFGDQIFRNIRGIAAFSIGGGSSLTLGASAMASGIASVFGGEGSVSISQTALQKNALYLDGSRNSDGGNLFTINNALLLEADTLLGSSNNDTLVLENSRSVGDSAFANLSGVNLLQLTGPSSVTLGDLAAGSGISSMIGGSRALSLIQGGAWDQPLRIDASANTVGGNYFGIDSASLVASETIVGSGGKKADTLAILFGDTVEDATFANLSGVGFLQLSGASTVTLDSAALAAGLSTVMGGVDGLTLSQTAGASKGLYINGAVNASAGNFLSFDSASLAASGTIVGSGRDDTLFLANADTVGDAFFTRIRGVGVLELSAGGAVTLGAQASASRISSVIGGADVLSFTQLQLGPAPYYVDASANNAGGNLFAFNYASLLSGNTVVGSEAGDTLALLNGAAFSDELFTGVSGISVLSLQGASFATLGDGALGAGIQTVVGGNGNSRFTVGELGTFTITGGAGKDTLVLSQGGLSVSDENFAGLSGIEVLSLSGFTNIDLSGENALASGLSLVAGGKGDSAFTLGDASAMSILGGEGTNTLTLTKPDQEIIGLSALSGVQILSLTGADTLDLSSGVPFGLQSILGGDGDSSYVLLQLGALSIFGGSGNNTLSLSQTGQILQDFSGLRGIGVLSLTGSNSVNLSDSLSASSSGISTVIGGDGNSRYIESAVGSFVLVGGAGSDTLVLDKPNLMVADADFTGTTGIEVLSLSGGNSVELGSIATASGLLSVIGGRGDCSFTMATLGTITLIGGDGNNTLAVTTPGQSVSGAAPFSGIDVLSLAGGDSVDLTTVPFGLSSVFGGDGGSVFTVSRLRTLQISGGKDADTLAVSQGNQLFQDYSGLSGIEVLSLTGSNQVTFDSLAQICGITSVVGGSGRLVTNQLAENSNQVYIDASAGTGGLFEFASALYAGQASILGGAGIDTLLIDQGDSLGDTLFEGMSSVDFLRLTGTNALTLGSSAAAAGLVSITGGFGDDTVMIAPSDTLSHWIFERTSMNFKLIVPDPSRLGSDTVIGNGFAGTLSVGSPGVLTSVPDAAFSRISGFTDLELVGSTNLTLGSGAAASGIRSLSLDGGTVSITQTSANAQRYRIDGSDTDLLSVTVATPAQLTTDILVGSPSASDSLTVGSGPVSDPSFTRVSGFENLILTGSMAVTLGYNAFASGLGTIYGGTGSSTIFQNSDNYSAMLLDGSAGASNLFRLGDPGLVSNDTLIGGGGTNTLAVGTSGYLDDDAFQNIFSVQILKLADRTLNPFLPSTPNVVVPGTKARDSGLLKIIGGNGNDLIDASAMPSGAGGRGVTLDGGGSAPLSDTLTGSDGSDLFILGSSSSTAYATTSNGSANFALITNFVSDNLVRGLAAGDRIQLRQADYAQSKYVLGAPANGGTRTNTHFGLYDNGKFVADITTSGFAVPADNSGNAAFLDPANNHVVYV